MHHLQVHFVSNDPKKLAIMKLEMDKVFKDDENMDEYEDESGDSGEDATCQDEEERTKAVPEEGRTKAAPEEERTKAPSLMQPAAHQQHGAASLPTGAIETIEQASLPTGAIETIVEQCGRTCAPNSVKTALGRLWVFFFVIVLLPTGYACVHFHLRCIAMPRTLASTTSQSPPHQLFSAKLVKLQRTMLSQVNQEKFSHTTCMSSLAGS